MLNKVSVPTKWVRNGSLDRDTAGQKTEAKPRLGFPGGTGFKRDISNSMNFSLHSDFLRLTSVSEESQSEWRGCLVHVIAEGRVSRPVELNKISNISRFFQLMEEVARHSVKKVQAEFERVLDSGPDKTVLIYRSLPATFESFLDKATDEVAPIWTGRDQSQYDITIRID